MSSFVMIIKFLQNKGLIFRLSLKNVYISTINFSKFIFNNYTISLTKTL